MWESQSHPANILAYISHKDIINQRPMGPPQYHRESVINPITKAGDSFRVPTLPQKEKRSIWESNYQQILGSGERAFHRKDGMFSSYLNEGALLKKLVGNKLQIEKLAREKQIEESVLKQSIPEVSHYYEASPLSARNKHMRYSSSTSLLNTPLRKSLPPKEHSTPGKSSQTHLTRPGMQEDSLDFYLKHHTSWVNTLNRDIAVNSMFNSPTKPAPKSRPLRSSFQMDAYFGNTDDMQDMDVVNDQLEEFDRRMDTSKRLNHYYPNKNLDELVKKKKS
eukprot:TRINITY_DN4992_c0_g1_i3.p1 TRINITY_DN4992_c0_g1~~TRINITY_DN4992_c0_g1_i3.p1  ORF type:complete len:304 (-),score=31.89 TRINITY_DN4992_c0_g1_i3:547-1380(-)